MKPNTNIVTIDGKSMPPISSLQISHEKIWSKNTGRGADGEMIGDVVAKKWKLEIGFAPLTDAQANLLETLLEPAFFTVSFKTPSGARKTVTMYAGTPVYPVYSYVSNLPRFNGVAVNLIEK